MPRLHRAARLAALPLALTLVGCSETVDGATPDLSAGQREACEKFADALPSEFVGLSPREVVPAETTTTAWGDPAVTVTCGATMPGDFTPGASCEEVNGVGWYVPIDQFSDLRETLTIFTIGRTPVVLLEIPADYRDNTAFAADALVTLADPVKQAIPDAQPCV